MDSFGAFTQCMVDGDAESLRRERKNRRFGLAVSVTFQVALLAALVLIPLMSQAVLPLIRINQIPLLRVPPPVQIVQTQPSHPSSTTTSYPVPSRSSAPISHHNLPTPIGSEVDLNLGPANFGPSGEGTDILELPSVPRPPEMPTTHPSDRPFVRGGKVMEALLINRIEPRYPAIASATHTSGEVVLNAIIGTDGAIRSLSVMSGNPLLIKAATDAVSQWRYKPTMLNGQPVEVQTVITVKFVLQD
jgi:protein TonB